MKGVSERRAAIFAALRELLLEHPWGDVTLEAVAKQAGVSRQTLYNAFGSRYGLAQAYTLDLAEALCDAMEETFAAHADDPRSGLEAGIRLFLEVAEADPLIRRVQTGEAHHDLVRIVTTDAAPLLVHVTGRLTDALGAAWTGVDGGTVQTIARTVARLALGYVSTPPETDEGPAEAARALASVLAPC